jgi:outer membrane protein assembly factor BamB
VKRDLEVSGGRQVGDSRTARAWLTVLIPALLTVVGACGDDGPTEPPGSARYDILVLNSTGQTLAPFFVDGDVILTAGSPTDLGAGFDGDAVAVSSRYAVSAISSFGGSRLSIVDLVSGGVTQATFQGPDAALVNPSRATLDAGDTVWVGGRGSDAVYRLDPGGSEAILVAAGVGEFVERVVPGDGEVYAIDANLDDDGLTWAPLGPGRVVVLSRTGVVLETIELPANALNPSDAVLASGRLIILAGGTFDPTTFAPNGDGAIVIVDPAGRTVTSTQPLQANGTSISLGADGLVYLTTTTDFVSLNLLRFDPRSGSFDRGPSNPIPSTDLAGDPVDCWTSTAVADGRILCATFRSDEPGRFLLLSSAGQALSETASGFGTTDIGIRP